MTKRPHEPGTTTAVDRLLLCALGALAVVAGRFDPAPTRLLLAVAAMALFVWATARLAHLNRTADFLHAFAPLVVIVGMFEAMGPLIGTANPARWDATFSALDDRLFGPLVPAWRHALGRPVWLCELASIAYVSYYVVPTAMGVALYARDRREEFDRFVFGLQVTLLASYAGYFFFPTSGPRVSLADAQAVLGGGAVSAAVRSFLHVAELNPLDAFPSGHTAVSITLLGYGWGMFPRWRALLAAVAGGIIFSTVYLSHHYIIDLVAGALVAVAALATTPVIQRAFALEAPRLAAKDSLSP